MAAEEGKVAGYTRFPVTAPPPDLPTLNDGSLRSGLDYDFPEDFVPKDVWAAAAAGRWAYVVKEMEENPGIVHTADIGGQTMLHWAALHGANVLVQRLLDMGASLNVLSGNGQTPFMWAAIQEQLETMELMRHNDVDMEVHDDNGATALLLAVQHKKPLAMLALLDMGASIDAVDNQGCGIAHYAASMGNMDALRILRSRNYPLNKLDNRGMQPLHRAARSDQGDVVRFLVENGNDPFLQAEGKTPREMAKELKRHYAASKILKCESSSRSMNGNIIEQVIAHLKAPKERDRWAWCAGWVVNFLGSATVYWANLLPVTAPHTLLNMVFLLCMGTLMVTYPILTLGDPGKVTPDTPKDRGSPGRGQQPGRHQHNSGDAHGSDEEQGLVNRGSFVHRLTEGIEGLARDQRAAFVCFSCDLVKPLRSKHCSSCDICVDRMDHHCVWINNCVGSGNQRMFNIFCICQTIALAIFSFFAFKAYYWLWIHSVSTAHFVRSIIYLYKLMCLHTIVNVLGSLMTVSIVYKQWINMAKNLTTNEEINLVRYEHFWREFQTDSGRRGKRFVNPFSRDRMTNWLEFWGLAPPKHVTMQEIVQIVQDNEAIRQRDMTLFGASGDAVVSAAGLAGGDHGHSHAGGDHGHSHAGGDHGHSHGH